MPSSSVDPDNGVPTAAEIDDAEAVLPSRPTGDERLVSSLRTQAEVDDLRDRHGIPSVYAARPAGDDRRACTPPPPGSVCVYAHALEAGMRVPLDGFSCEVLVHFGIAPAQLVPNAWRVMAGFLALCNSAGVPPSLAVFRRFFLLYIVNKKHKGRYCFRARDSSGAGLRFTGMPGTPMDWKKLFFFLSSPEPWPCPVEWGKPSMSSFTNPALTSEEGKSAAKLLRAYGGAAVDIKTCLCDRNRAIAMVTAASPPPPLTPSSSTTTRVNSSSKGMDPSVYDMMKTMLAEKAASAKKVKAEVGSNAPAPPPSCGRKRGLDEANGEDSSAHSLLNTPLSGMCSPPPGFPRKPHRFPSRHDGDATGWEAARERLQGAISPPQERAFAAKEPSDVVRSSYAAILQAANYASFSLGYALELEKKLAARDAEVAALRGQLEAAKVELAAVQHAAGAGRETANAELAAEEHVLGPEERVRRRAEHALEGYERWRGSRRAAPTT
ncbi:unnamed protein product [Triticum turgidum subsp. durum]|uniref:Transposase (putative) gypsy type domain-containing protein n=1 Tax=Triticum turgidum subsp. durum TaxID=4567 RepID=A0A9R0ZSM0_TRITD|nr:unnamed protein product [Triticum turgidum subsp. durum]